MTPESVLQSYWWYMVCVYCWVVHVWGSVCLCVSPQVRVFVCVCVTLYFSVVSTAAHSHPSSSRSHGNRRHCYPSPGEPFLKGRGWWSLLKGTAGNVSRNWRALIGLVWYYTHYTYLHSPPPQSLNHSTWLIHADTLLVTMAALAALQPTATALQWKN